MYNRVFYRHATLLLRAIWLPWSIKAEELTAPPAPPSHSHSHSNGKETSSSASINTTHDTNGNNGSSVNDIRGRLGSYGILYRMRFSAVLVLCVLLRPLLTLLWYIDDMLWPDYKHVQVKQPVFIVSGARTGSTRLHEVMAHAGGNKFASFTLVQFFNPYLTGQWLLTLVRRADAYWLRGIGARIFRLIERRAIPKEMQCNQSILVPSSLLYHPMIHSVFVI
jgi:hypothetical protein